MAIWKSATLWSWPPITPSAISPSTRSSSAGHGAQVTPHRVIARVVEPGGEPDDGRGGARREAGGDAEVRALEIGLERGAVAPQRRPDDPPRHGLEHLVPPALGGHHRLAVARLGGHERVAGHQRVERQGDRPRALEALAVESHRGHRHPREAQRAQNHPVHPRHQVEAPHLHALLLEHELACQGRVGAGHTEERRAHGRILWRTTAAAACARREPGGSRSYLQYLLACKHLHH